MEVGTKREWSASLSGRCGPANEPRIHTEQKNGRGPEKIWTQRRRDKSLDPAGIQPQIPGFHPWSLYRMSYIGLSVSSRVICKLSLCYVAYRQLRIPKYDSTG
jgi:hypothetical protein